MHDAPLVIVSGDTDWGRFCIDKEIAHFSGLSAYLNDRQDPASVAGVQSFLESSWQEVVGAIGAELRDMTLYTSDADGEVEDISLLEGDLESFYVLDQQEGAISIELFVEVDLEGSASYMEPGTGYYDKEVDAVFMAEFSTETIERRVWLEIELGLGFEGHDIAGAEIEELQIKNSPTIRLFED